MVLPRAQMGAGTKLRTCTAACNFPASPVLIASPFVRVASCCPASGRCGQTAPTCYGQSRYHVQDETIFQ